MAPQQGMYGQTPTGPTEPDAWLAALDDVRRPQLEELDARIRRVAPGLRRYVDRGFLSYGRYTYRSRAGRSGDWMCLAVASNKQYISLYAGPIGLEPFAPGFRRPAWAEAASASSAWPTSTSTSSTRSSAPRPPPTARRSPSEARRSRCAGFPSPDAGKPAPLRVPIQGGENAGSSFRFASGRAMSSPRPPGNAGAGVARDVPGAGSGQEIRSATRCVCRGQERQANLPARPRNGPEDPGHRHCRTSETSPPAARGGEVDTGIVPRGCKRESAV